MNNGTKDKGLLHMICNIFTNRQDALFPRHPCNVCRNKFLPPKGGYVHVFSLGTTGYNHISIVVWFASVSSA